MRQAKLTDEQIVALLRASAQFGPGGHGDEAAPATQGRPARQLRACSGTSR
jgi:hypothetical protein